MGYHECLTETMHFLVEKEGLYAGNSFCVRLMSHLQKHFDKLGRGWSHLILGGLELVTFIIIDKGGKWFILFCALLGARPPAFIV